MNLLTLIAAIVLAAQAAHADAQPFASVTGLLTGCPAWLPPQCVPTSAAGYLLTLTSGTAAFTLWYSDGSSDHVQVSAPGKPVHTAKELSNWKVEFPKPSHQSNKLSH